MQRATVYADAKKTKEPPDVFIVAPLGIFQAAVEPIELYFAGSPRQWAGTNLAFA